MNHFAPSVDAAREALGGAAPITKGEIPTGTAGAKYSLEEISKRIRAGRIDPRVRGWAGRALMEDGSPETIKDKCRAILKKLRSQTIYTPDPVGAEFIAGARYTLCLDELGLCLPSADCDDLTVALGSGLMSQGISVQVLAQCFDSSNVPTHVLVAAETSPGKWDRIDPSSKKFDVGEYFPATKEWWFDPMKDINLDESGDLAGDFVGVGTPHIAAVANNPWPHGSNEDRYWHPWRYGVGEYANVVLQIPDAPKLSDQQKAAIYDGTTEQLRIAVDGLDQAVMGLESALKNIEQVKTILNPSQPFDTDDGSITSVLDFPTSGVWTKNMDNISWWLVGIGKKFVQAGREALNGTRRIFVDQKTQDAYVEGNDQDTFRLNTIRKVGGAVLAFVNPVGAAIAGLTAKEGRVLTKEETEREILAARSATGVQGAVGVGIAPVVIVVAVVVGAVVQSIVAMIIVKEWCHMAEVKAIEATRTEMMKCVASGRCSVDDVIRIEKEQSKSRVEEEKARAQTDPFASIAKAALYMAIGGGVLAGAYVLSPVIKASAERWREKHTR